LRYRSFPIICIFVALISGCSHLGEGYKVKRTLEEANSLFSQGEYQASLDKYRQIEGYPPTTDKVLFEMGIISAYPKNERKDYGKALEYFHRLVKEYPGSPYRQDSEMMIFYIDSVAAKDGVIGDQQKQIAALRQGAQDLEQEVKRKESEVVALHEKIAALRQEILSFALKGSVDKILIEKKRRRLMLISNGEVLKTYKIALGGDPDGPKERQGDNKTPEGTYVIDSRNKGSRYHLSLHISYPNEKDKRHARELGVSPGGDIMIHGIKNGYSWVGGMQSEIDWTKGCIAVTDEEIEEIAKLAPNGTPVEIRP